jgi:peptidoglycan/xylan/chitin deacetylase (PgdA/CDA1 family)
MQEVVGHRPARIDSVRDPSAKRIALTFDDGPSVYRPDTLRILRDRQVPATFFDVGMRIDANPQLSRFAADEGHVVLNHTYSHPDLAKLGARAVRREVGRAQEALERAGVRVPFPGLRPPFLSVSPVVRREVDRLGYVLLTPIEDVDSGTVVFHDEWEPDKTPADIRDLFLGGLDSGRVFIFHDGAIDSPAGAAVIEALPTIIDEARARGYGFGVLDENDDVVAAAYEPCAAPIPDIRQAVPYLPLRHSEIEPPDPYVLRRATRGRLRRR